MIQLIGNKRRVILMVGDGGGSSSSSSSSSSGGEGGGNGSSSNSSSSNGEGSGEGSSSSSTGGEGGNSDGGSEGSQGGQQGGPSTLGTNGYTPGANSTNKGPSQHGMYDSKGNKTGSFTTDSNGNVSVGDVSGVDTDREYDDRGFKINKEYVEKTYKGKEALSNAEKSARNRENGINDWGKNMDFNNDGKIGPLEALAMNVTNKAKAVDMAFGGLDQYGANLAGNMNGINQSRGKNMMQNIANNLNKAFGGIGKYDGTTKNGEHFSPGQKAGFLGRLSNIGKGIATNNGKTWNDSNHDGKMDGKELGKAITANLVTSVLGKAPMVGKSLQSFLNGAVSDGSRAQTSYLGQLGQQMASKNVNNPNVGISHNTSSSGSGPSKQQETELKKNITEPPNNTKHFKVAMKSKYKEVPTTSAVYVSRKQDKDQAVTVSDERCKRFATHKLFK